MTRTHQSLTMANILRSLRELAVLEHMWKPRKLYTSLGREKKDTPMVRLLKIFYNLTKV